MTVTCCSPSYRLWGRWWRWGGWRSRGCLQGTSTAAKAKRSLPWSPVSIFFNIIWFQCYQCRRSRHTSDPVWWWRSTRRHSASNLCSQYKRWRNRGRRWRRTMLFNNPSKRLNIFPSPGAYAFFFNELKCPACLGQLWLPLSFRLCILYDLPPLLYKLCGRFIW